MDTQGFDNWPQWVIWGATTLVVVCVAMLLQRLTMKLLRRLAGQTSTSIDDRFVKRLGPPLAFLLPLLGIQLMMASSGMDESIRAAVQHAIAIGLIVAVAWVATGAVAFTTATLLSRHDMSERNNLEARRIHTQVRVLTRSINIVVIIVAAAAILMTFPRIRQLGMSLLASAGIAGLVVGLAARPTLSNLIAGVQLALTRPINLDDVVIVEGEWGRIEEITSTYVVVKIWDERRLIVPLTQFLEKPFQNWTRTTADLLGTVFIYCDYRVPVDDVRDELKRLVENDEAWDTRVALVQITDTKPNTVEMRALVSAGDAPSLWDLRCRVREGLIQYLEREHPESLPTVRAEVTDLRRSEISASA